MVTANLYEADFVLWTEQQAQALRQLKGATNSLDIPNLAEEIEDLGKRDVREVEGLIRQVMDHLLKAAHFTDSDAIRHWRAEIINFQDEARRAFTASMRQKIDMDGLWQTAVSSFSERAGLDHQRKSVLAVEAALRGSPLALDALVSGRFDLDTALAEVQARLGPAA